MSSDCIYRAGEVVVRITIVAGMIPVVIVGYVAVQTVVGVQAISLPVVAVGEYIATGDFQLTEQIRTNIANTPENISYALNCFN